MGATLGRAEEAAPGKSLVLVNTIEGHRAWAPSYDAGRNPLLALEKRVLSDRLVSRDARTFVDVGCGTGRWMQVLWQNGSQVFGVDLCREMLLEAAGKPRLGGHLSLADACRLPIANDVADLVLCSFTWGYFPLVDRAIAEMARILRPSGRVIVSDVHPDALRAGWKRAFRSNGEVYEIDHYVHSAAVWEAAGESCGMRVEWRVEASFGEAERAIFREAGKDTAFDELSRTPALLAMCWTKACD